MAKSVTLEFTILSAEDLSIAGRPVKKNAFAVVRTDQFNSKSTTADLDGGSYPRWNDRFVVEMPRRTNSVTVEVQCKGGSGNRVVGTAIVPASDFLGGLTPDGYLHFLSYRLRDPRGARNGIVNFSVRVCGGGIGDYGGCSVAARKKEGVEFGANFASSYSASTSWAAPSSSSSSSWGMPAGGDRSGYGSGGGVVTGVPVWGAHKA